MKPQLMDRGHRRRQTLLIRWLIRFEEKGIPAFRTADEALRAFNQFCSVTLKNRATL
jgi:hypothetical protein